MITIDSFSFHELFCSGVMSHLCCLFRGDRFCIENKSCLLPLHQKFWTCLWWVTFLQCAFAMAVSSLHRLQATWLGGGVGRKGGGVSFCLSPSSGAAEVPAIRKMSQDLGQGSLAAETGTDVLCLCRVLFVPLYCRPHVDCHSVKQLTWWCPPISTIANNLLNKKKYWY